MADVNLSTTETLAIHATDTVSGLAKTTPTTLVEYLIAGETIFPSGYDIAAVAGDGITMRERSLSDNWLALLGNNYVVSGLVFPASSLTLSLTVPLGIAFIAGRYLNLPAKALTFSPSTTSWVFLKVTRDASLNVTGAYYEVNTTGTFPSVDYIPMGKVVSAIGSITSTQQDPMVKSISKLPIGPVGTGANSTAAHEGTVALNTQALSGIHFYTDFTLNTGQTLTVADNAGRLCIMATGTITINGTIDAIGAGGLGGAGSATGDYARSGGPGTSQPGGGGGGGAAGSLGGDGGAALPAQGGVGGAAGVNGAQGQDNTGALIGISSPLGIFGGGGGGGGGGGSGGAGGAGGNGGGSVILCAPTVVFGSASTVNTSGANGVGGGGGTTGGGGGGSAGNLHIFCRSYTDNGLTFTATAGAGAAAGGGDGAAGRAGVKQILIY